MANLKREQAMQDLPKRRAEATLRKQVRLTGETIERIHAWRTTQGGNCSFSAAIEALARIGLGDDPSTAFMSVMVSVMRRQFETLSNRLARLASHSAIESGIASRLTGFLVLRTPTTKELMHPQAYERLRQLARRDSAWLLRRSLREAMPEIFEAWERERQDVKEQVPDG